MAWELRRSYALFRGTLGSLEGRGDVAYVFSAKCGLLPLDEVVEPYDPTLIGAAAVLAVVQRRSRDLIRRQAELESQLAAIRQERERWAQWEPKLRSLEGIELAHRQAQGRLEAAERRHRECQIEIETISREQLSRQASRHGWNSYRRRCPDWRRRRRRPAGGWPLQRSG